MRWTSKQMWLAALGAGLVAWPAWAQDSEGYDDTGDSSSSSRQYQDDSDSASSRSSRQTSRQNDYEDDDSDSSSRSPSRSQNQSYSQSQRSGRQASSSDYNRSGQPSRSATGRSTTGRATTQTRSTQRSDRSSDDWFGFGGSNQSAQNEQWSDWDSEKDIREAGVWRASNLIGKQVKNSRGEDLGEIKDIVVDLNNHEIRYLAISHGGALGIGESLFAVSLDQLRMQRDDDGQDLFVLNVDQDAFENAQGFEEQRNWPTEADRSLDARSRTQVARTRESSMRQGSQSTAQQGRSFQGEFEEYDEDADQLIVRTSDGRRRVYHVSAGVRVTSNGQRRTLDELEEGDQIRLSYTTDRNNRTTITAVEDAPQQRTASRTRSQSYNSASYDPSNEQSSSRSQADRSRSTRMQSESNSGRDTQRSGRSTGSSYDSGMDDNRFNRSSTRSDSDYGDGGASFRRSRSSERSANNAASTYSDDSADSDDDSDSSTSRSSSRNRSSSSDDSDDSDSSTNSDSDSDSESSYDSDE